MNHARRSDIVTGTPADGFYALVASATRQMLCRRGEHEEETVTSKRVVYAGNPKRRLHPGDRYCIYCAATLAPLVNADCGYGIVPEAWHHGYGPPMVPEDRCER